MIVPNVPGASLDRWARFWAPLISDELPGKPPIKIDNIIGDGHMEGAREFGKLGKERKLVMFAADSHIFLPHIFGNSEQEIDHHAWKALLSSRNGGVLFASPEIVDDSEKTPRFWDGNELRVSMHDPKDTDAMVILSLSMLGKSFTPVYSTNTLSDSLSKFQSGMTNVSMLPTDYYSANIARLVRDGSALPLFSLGVPTKEGLITRDPNFPNIPHFLEYYENLTGTKPDGEAIEAWQRLHEAIFLTKYTLYVPGTIGNPEYRALQAAIKKAVENEKGWPKSWEEVIGEYEHIYGPRAENQVGSIERLPKGLTDWYDQLIENSLGDV